MILILVHFLTQETHAAQQVNVGTARHQRRFVAIKCSLSAIKWNPEHMEALQNLVVTVNELTTNTYLFSRLLFTRELYPNQNFLLSHFVTKEFFTEVFLSLTTRHEHGSIATPQTLEYRDLIRSCLPYYRMITGFRPIALPKGQQIALYQANAIFTCYLNTTMNGFGQQLRRVINRILDVKSRANNRKTQLREQGYAQTDINAIIEQEIYGPAREFKLAVAQRPIDIRAIPNGMNNAFNKLQPLFSSYPAEYRFQENSIYYDSQVNPEKHLLAYYNLTKICETESISSFQCFPLRNSWTPAYMQIDTTILRDHILHEARGTYTMEAKMESWGKVVDLNCKAMKAQGMPDDIKFRGTLHTDGVGVTVIKTNEDTRAGGPRHQINRRTEKEPNITDLSITELRATTGQCVLIDPNRRDLLFCMHENSTPEEPFVLRYTKNTQSKQRKERKFRKLRESKKQQSPNINEAEQKLGRVSRSTSLPHVFSLYLIERTKVSAELKNFYSNTSTDRMLHPVPLHRKLKLSSILNKNREDDRLANSIRAQFGQNCILVMGNWSATMAKFHQLIRGIGMRRALRKRGFRLLMIDEYNTSRHCPDCQEKTLENFRRVPNPRPWQRQDQPTVICHGLLRCTNQNCLQSMASHRLLNRDVVATRNMCHILHGLRQEGTRPRRFCRPRPRTRRQAIDPQ